MNYHQIIINLLLGTVLCFSACQEPTPPTLNHEFAVRVLQIREATRLNPILRSGYGRQIIPMIFQKLLAFSPETMELIPQLAKTTPTETPIVDGEFKGGTAYSFEIHKAAKWDNGTPVTGHDVAFTLKTIFNPRVSSASVASFLSIVRDIEIDPKNPKKFTIFTDRQYILAKDAISNMDVLPAYLYDPNGLMDNFSLKDLTDPKQQARFADNEQIIQFGAAFSKAKYSREKDFVGGSGPYQLAEWATGQHITLTRKKDWWGDALAKEFPALQAHPEKLIFKPIKDPAAQLIAIKGGEVDVATQINIFDFQNLQKDELAKEKYNFFTKPTSRISAINIYTKHPLLQDKKVRRALAHLLDVDEILEKSYQKSGNRAVGPVHQNKAYFAKNLHLISYDLEKAKKILAAADWLDSNNNGTLDKEIDGELRELKIPFSIMSGIQVQEEIALLFQKNARQVGIEIDIQTQEFETLIRNLKQRNYALSIGTIVATPTSMDDFMPLYHTSSDHAGGYNRTGFGNEKTDALIEEINQTMKQEKRNNLYREFQEILYDEQPQIFLFSPNEHIVVNKQFVPKLSEITPGYYLPQFEIFEMDSNYPNK